MPSEFYTIVAALAQLQRFYTRRKTPKLADIQQLSFDFEQVFSPLVRVSNSFDVRIHSVRTLVQSARYRDLRSRNFAVVPYYEE
jgi:predicted glycoside hydrolase/deacetylase ChbG (UPF0249 family)